MKLDETKTLDMGYEKNLIITNVVVFPGEVIEVGLSLEQSKQLRNSIHDFGNEVVLGIVKNLETKEVTKLEDLEKYGILCNLMEISNDFNKMKLKIKGIKRVELLEIEPRKNRAKIKDVFIDTTNLVNEDKQIVYLSDLIRKLKSYNDMEIKETALIKFKEIGNVFEFIKYILTKVEIDLNFKLKILLSDTLEELFLNLSNALKFKLDLEKLDKEVDATLNKRFMEANRKYHIKERIKALYEQIDEEDPEDEILELEENILKKGLPVDLEKKLIKEVLRLKKMHESSAEASVIRTYLDTVIELPWERNENKDIDILKAEKILNDEHYGLKEVKNTILEYLAVNQLNKNNKNKMGTILCLIGPPGVGKTSLGESIAHAMGRKFERIALGGVSDESEIRGHRRTYIGSMPGRIIEAIKRSKVSNPVILLDEIDKLSSNYKGDPASALLEVLDPAQNKTFKDNYIDYEFDLSDAFFICTANDYSGIPGPLLDRMEIINVSSYTIAEKLSIAKNYLIKQVKEETSIKDIKLSDAVILDIINKYTSEAGVRNLKREIAKIFRKVAKIKLEGKESKISITTKNLSNYLGLEKYKKDKKSNSKSKLGVVKGLAWTAVGGTTLDVEAVKMDGKGSLQFTGTLGDVMKESSQVAYTFVRANYDKLGIKNKDFYKENDVHLHFPEGATPKDGPSAGITITTAIVSALSDRKVRQDIAMTGEITIVGDVLPVGGIKEKVLGAMRIGINEVILPYDNKEDTKEINEETLSQLKIHYVKKYSEVANIVFSD